jgi:uncharacterized protein
MGVPTDMQKSQINTQLTAALSHWDNEGGAGANGPQKSSKAHPVKEVATTETDVSSVSAITSFFVLTFAWSWLLGFIAIYSMPYVPRFSTVASIISGFGPSMAAVVIIIFFSGRKGLKDWLKKALNGRVGWQWYALAFVIPPLVMVLAQAIHWALGGTVPTSPAAEHIQLAIANFGLVFLIGGPLGEELGWRSYGVPALGNKMGWRTASLIIGVIWGLWHVPWFFTVGTAQSQMPFGVFMLNIIAGSVLFSWLFLNSAGSVIPALVAHTSLNAFAGILSIIPTAETSRPYTLVTGILVAIAAWLLLHPDTQQTSSFQNRKSS